MESKREKQRDIERQRETYLIMLEETVSVYLCSSIDLISILVEIERQR